MRAPHTRARELQSSPELNSYSIQLVTTAAMASSSSMYAPKNTLLGATNYDPRLKSHLKPQRFKLVESHLRIDSALSQLNQLTTRSDLPDSRGFDTTSSDIGGRLDAPLSESKFAPQNVTKVRAKRLHPVISRLTLC